MTAIYDVIRAAIESGADVEELDLDGEAGAPGEIRWAAGALDGVLSHHTSGGGDHAAAEALGAAIVSAATGRDDTTLLDLAADVNVSQIDAVLDDVRQYNLDPAAVERLGLRLATTAETPGAVKLGIGLLGRFGDGTHRDVLLTLGRHSEFTLYAAVALASGRDADDDLWQLARQVHGWGRIHLVERLADSPRADIREWILRSGFRNSVMNEYLAWYAATAGGLLGHLLVDEVDEELLLAAADILDALIQGGPARDMDDYADGAAATMAYLALISGDRGRDLAHLLTTDAIRRYTAAERDDRPWPPGWTPELRQACATACAQIIAAPYWPALVTAAIESDDEALAWKAGQASRILGISTMDTLMRQLRRRDDSEKWYDLMSQADESSIDAVLDLAGELLPLADIATGPTAALGIGPEFAPHESLDRVVGALPDWPGRGWKLIDAALRSPGVRLRNMAVRALGAWSHEQWTDTVRESVRQALAHEPDSDLRARMQALLAQHERAHDSR